MVQRTRHLTGAAKPGEPNDRPRAPAPPPPPRWRMWLLPLGVVITLILLSLPHMSSTPTKNFSYSKFVSEVEAGDVHTASINPSGAITGTLEGRRRLHQPDPDGHHRHPAGAHAEGPRCGRHRRRTRIGPPRGHPLVRPVLVAPRLLHLDGTAERQDSSPGGSWASGVRRPRSTTRTGPRPDSATSPGTREQSVRWPRWWTS